MYEACEQIRRVFLATERQVAPVREYACPKVQLSGSATAVSLTLTEREIPVICGAIERFCGAHGISGLCSLCT